MALFFRPCRLLTKNLTRFSGVRWLSTVAAHRLLGPPEIHPSPATNETAHPTGNPFLDLMDSRFNADPTQPPPGMGRTENFSPTFLSSGDPCLDYFFQVVPDTAEGTVTSLLSSAWSQDPLTALKLVCHLRDIRGTGKSDRKGFYSSALWIHQRHPKTLALNASTIADFGYMKDLPEILHLLVAGPDTHKAMTRDWSRRWSSYEKRDKVGTKEERLAAEEAKVRKEIEEAAILRRKKRAEMATKAVQRYAGDADYRLLHDQTADFFATLLRWDLERLKSGDMKHFSLAAKWCPSPDSSYDRSTLLCEAIARRLFPRESDPDYLAIEEQHYTYRIRSRLFKEVLVPLRKALHLPEVYMSAQQWESIRYTRVASVAMKNYKEFFLKHDEKRFSEFIEKVKKGEAKIAAGALLPHDIVNSVCGGEDDEVAELQWKRIVSDLSEIGKLRNCIAVCDVSSSMNGTPMEVCVALGLLISEMSEEPWKGRVITFTRNPEMHYIQGESLREKTMFIRHMDWGYNTDFQKVFDQILRVAVEGKLEAEKMVKKVFVFSDMEFDQASSAGYQSPYWSRNSQVTQNRWETDYEMICRKFEESGYGSVVPEIVFWNLRDSRSTPVKSDQKGVALVSGFSKNMVKLFLKGGEMPSPKDVMEAAIAGEEYKKLVVHD